VLGRALNRDPPPDWTRNGPSRKGLLRWRNANRFNGLFAGSFHDFLDKNTDKWIETEEYLKNCGAQFAPNLAPLVDAHGVFSKQPDEMTAKLMSGGKPVTGW
jgi:hypothetical protein